MPAGEEGSLEHTQTAPGVTLAICAFNEAANISRQIELILAEDPNAGFVTEVLVVSSGSTDGTNELVRDFSHRVPRLRLIEEAERRGKVAAVNIVIREAKCDRIVLMGADCILSRGALRRLAAAFADERVGGVGTRNVPVNAKESLMARAADLMWQLHHAVVLGRPVLGGDIVAFRRPGAYLPENGDVNDDFLIECQLRDEGYTIAYDPEALTFMRVPTSVGDFVRQRRRIHFGFLHAWRSSRRVKSTRALRVIVAAFKVLGRRPQLLPLLAFLVVIEAWSRLLAILDAVRGRSHAVWAPSASTKGRIEIPGAAL